mmetsp:Transcript_75566/g.231204  ORF Transcript_75566/g.231204 Transcript_75566/m.231204 type:complete len:243 (-) Transcript_75566:96-824(-)
MRSGQRQPRSGGDLAEVRGASRQAIKFVQRRRRRGFRRHRACEHCASEAQGGRLGASTQRGPVELVLDGRLDGLAAPHQVLRQARPCHVRDAGEHERWGAGAAAGTAHATGRPRVGPGRGCAGRAERCSRESGRLRHPTGPVVLVHMARAGLGTGVGGRAGPLVPPHGPPGRPHRDALRSPHGLGHLVCLVRKLGGQGGCHCQLEQARPLWSTSGGADRAARNGRPCVSPQVAVGQQRHRRA